MIQQWKREPIYLDHWLEEINTDPSIISAVTNLRAIYFGNMLTPTKEVEHMQSTIGWRFLFSKDSGSHHAKSINGYITITPTVANQLSQFWDIGYRLLTQHIENEHNAVRDELLDQLTYNVLPNRVSEMFWETEIERGIKLN